MTSIGSIVPTAIDALLLALSDQAAFTAIDGPGMTDASLKDALFIGCENTDGLDFIPAAALDQAWGSLGAQMRDETAQIHCVAESWGGTDLKAARDRVFATFTTVMQVLHDDPSLGTAGASTTLYVQPPVDGASFNQTTDESGALAQINFNIGLKGRVLP